MHIAGGTALATLCITAVSGVGIRPDAQNPHAFNLKGETVVLVGSGEHYGAVFNLDFNYSIYLKTLAADGLRLVRIWTGAWWVQWPEDFNEINSTAAPAPGRYLAPWAISDNECCYNNTPGLNKYDLTRVNPDYFARLSDFLSEAAQYGIVVNLGLTSVFYDSNEWLTSPISPGNNVNGIGANLTADTMNEVYISPENHKDVQATLPVFLTALATALGPHDNMFLEIINEPWESNIYDPTLFIEWQNSVAEQWMAIEAASGTGNSHILSLCYANVFRKLLALPSWASYVSWHYTIPETIQQNWGLGVPIGTSETGWTGQADEPYRVQAWVTMLSGAATLNGLDYSFSTGYPNGTWKCPKTNWGGGPTLRKSLGFLQRTLTSLPLAYVTPMRDIVTRLDISPTRWAYAAKWAVLGNVSQAQGVLLLYLGNTAVINATNPGAAGSSCTFILELQLPVLSGVSSSWSGQWLDTVNATSSQPIKVTATSAGLLQITSPRVNTDIALLLNRDPSVEARDL